MTDLHKALGLDDPGRLAIYRRTVELVAPIAEAAVDCLIGKAAAEDPTGGAVPALVRRKMIQMYAGVTAQFTLALSDMASLKRELAERSRAVDAEERRDLEPLTPVLTLQRN
jgi:hypothetical protein